jgi:hypothetical protein
MIKKKVGEKKERAQCLETGDCRAGRGSLGPDRGRRRQGLRFLKWVPFATASLWKKQDQALKGMNNADRAK